MEGKCIIFSAPSGAGKTTIVKNLLKKDFNLEFSVSACSRGQRKGETQGKDYYFLSVEDFKKGIKNDDFLEWEEVYTDNFYGTLKSEIERIWKKGHHVIFDVDVVGGLNLKKYFGDKALACFVKPPSIKHLEERLRTRDTETEESIARRMGKAEQELLVVDRFDVVVYNEVLEDAIKQAEETVSNFLEISKPV